LIPMLTTLKAMDDGDVPIHVTSSQARAEAGSRHLPPGPGGADTTSAVAVGAANDATLPLSPVPDSRSLTTDERRVTSDMRHILTAAVGHSLWVGPSQAQTPSDRVGVYVKGYVPPGTVVGMYLGRVYNQEMMMRASDAGHLADADAARRFVLRYDDTVIDTCDELPGVDNPYAMAQYVRHPPVGIVPNVMRLQYDVMDDDSPIPLTPLPKELRQYVPNQWGAAKTMANSFVNMAEQGIVMKCCVLVANRELLDEELFVDHQLNPFGPRPEWYTPINQEADELLWSSITDR